MTDHLTSRAQRLIEEFEEGESVRHGIANVLNHLAYSHREEDMGWYVPASTLEKYAEELTAPTLLDRALAGDRAAAKQFLRDFGLIDEHGQLTGPYAPENLMLMTEFPAIDRSGLQFPESPKINCPRHGLHPHVIASTIPGHEGYWCQICWLEMLGEPLQLIDQELPPS